MHAVVRAVGMCALLCQRRTVLNTATVVTVVRVNSPCYLAALLSAEDSAAQGAACLHVATGAVCSI